MNYQKILHEGLMENMKLEKVLLVWFSKNLQNAKGLFISSDDNFSKYYEVTYDGVKDKLYIDVYVKEDNIVVNDVTC